MSLSREEQIEQVFFFRSLLERLADNVAMQELLPLLREEVLATTKLPMAIDYLLTELTHHGVMAPAMQQLNHYFSPFQAFVVAEAERERGRFDFRVGLEILRKQAEYLAATPTRPGLFMYQFEAICRNRLSYDKGLLAVSQDPFLDEAWKNWVLTVRRQIGIVELADMVYVRSEYYVLQKSARHEPPPLSGAEILFGEKEGRIAMANRQKDPLLLLAALQRQLSISGRTATQVHGRQAISVGTDGSPPGAAGNAAEATGRGAARRDRHYQILQFARTSLVMGCSNQVLWNRRDDPADWSSVPIAADTRPRCRHGLRPGRAHPGWRGHLAPGPNPRCQIRDSHRRPRIDNISRCGRSWRVDFVGFAVNFQQVYEVASSAG